MRRRNERSGQAIVEFALAAPIFLFVLFILIDFGRVIYAQNALTQAADAAARYGSTAAAQTPTSTRDAAIREHARVVPLTLPDSAITGKTSASGAFYPEGITPPGHVYVEITTTVPILTPFVSDAVGGSFTLSASADELIR